MMSIKAFRAYTKARKMEQADIGTPVATGIGALRGRLAVRRVRAPNLLNLPTPRTPRCDDGTVMIVDPSDKAITYRMPGQPSVRLPTYKGTPQGMPGLKPTRLGTPLRTMPPLPSERQLELSPRNNERA